VHDPPYGSDGLAVNVKRNQQALFRRGDHRHQSSAPDVRRYHAGDGRPIKPFPAIRREKTQPRGIALGNVQDCLGEGLKNIGRRVAQGGDQRHKRAILLFEVGRTRGTAMKLLCTDDRFERGRALRHRSIEREAIFRFGFGHLFTSTSWGHLKRENE
jgi:hypothetical protein